MSICTSLLAAQMHANKKKETAHGWLERVRHLLRGSMLDIVEAIGVKSACELVKAIGGERALSFGRGKQDTPRLHILFAAIGEAKTYQLLRVFGGEELYVPRCGEALRELRNEQFRHEFLVLTEREGVSKLMAMSAFNIRNTRFRSARATRLCAAAWSPVEPSANFSF